jgi:hypothetical protein
LTLIHRICQHTYVKRTTVKLPEEFDARLRKEAELRQTTVSALVREAIEQFLVGRPRRRRRLPFTGLFASGYTDTSERVDEILAEIFEDQFGRGRPRH